MTCSQNNNEHKNVKNPSKEAGGGGVNGGSPQSKQVGLKPACPSFQPSEIRDKQMLKPSG